MSKIALVRIGLVATRDNIISDLNPDGRILYDEAILAPDPAVLIDHDDDRRIGTVLDTFHMEDTIGAGRLTARCLVARCRIDNPPEWLHAGTTASFGSAALRRTELNGWEIQRKVRLAEVSILLPSSRPAEPLARVLLIRDEPEHARPLNRHQRDLDHLRALIVLGVDPEEAVRRLRARAA